MSDSATVSGFYDFGRIARDKGAALAMTRAGNYSLQGVGVGVDWRIGHASVGAALATRVATNQAAQGSGHDGDGTKRSPRFWLSAIVPFAS